ncbi:MAG: hypothetical protein II974_11075 [Firmicutes bacterium]|nr:hypothetical protein [Bacillota bacterium]MBQ6013274.1 hypothetical protein [Bacillota bacterium]
MKTLTFEIAKKMGRPAAGASGILLSSVRGDGMKAVMVISSSSYDELKERVSSMHQQGLPINYRTRGKSLEVTASPGNGIDALAVLFSYASQLEFALDDAQDVMGFCAGCRSFLDGCMEPLSIALDKDSLSLKMKAQIGDEEDPQGFYERLMEILTKADMGVIKQ